MKKRNTDKLRYGLVKMMLDGSIQGFSARMRWPGHFNGAPNGIWVTAPSQYEADFEIYHRAGLHIHTHTNGDEASLVFGRWLRKHGVSQVKVAMKDLIVALFAPQTIAIYPN
jgi:predicted amidohydrolase YtcJ